MTPEAIARYFIEASGGSLYFVVTPDVLARVDEGAERRRLGTRSALLALLRAGA